MWKEILVDGVVDSSGVEVIFVIGWQLRSGDSITVLTGNILEGYWDERERAPY